MAGRTSTVTAGRTSTVMAACLSVMPACLSVMAACLSVMPALEAGIHANATRPVFAWMAGKGCV
jgi:hypothetical protein